MTSNARHLTGCIVLITDATSGSKRAIGDLEYLGRVVEQAGFDGHAENGKNALGETIREGLERCFLDRKKW